MAGATSIVFMMVLEYIIALAILATHRTIRPVLQLTTAQQAMVAAIKYAFTTGQPLLIAHAIMDISWMWLPARQSTIAISVMADVTNTASMMALVSFIAAAILVIL